MNLLIIDYGMGNIGSIVNMFIRMGVYARYSSDVADIQNADKIILPGVGSFDAGMKQLSQSGLISALEKKVLEEKTPILGICLGMQLLFRNSEEGRESGLGWLKGHSVKFVPKNQKNLKIPHMGWNTVTPYRTDSLFQELHCDSRFYFVHSFHVICEDEKDILSHTTYDSPFVSSVQHHHIYGVQFHPEKSHRYGMQLLKNFVECL